MAGWVRWVWWPLMVLFTVGSVASVAQGVWRLADGRPGSGVISLVFGGLGVLVVVREWPRWRVVTFGPERG